AREIATSAARFCAELGVPAILVPVTPGEGVEDAEGKKRWIEEMKRCAPVAEETGVTLALENVGRGYGKSADDLIALVDGISSPKVGVYYDCGNATYFQNDPADEILRLGKRIAQAHTKEVEGTLMGEGKVDHLGSLRALKAIGYDGYIVLETNATDDPDRAALANLAFLKRVMGEM
ncbi:MAG: sugar phosphate isomerase/epimerase, partial [Armatimonadetes bacterium]|nr:sugar phosphate isomerase/epimerase [Armatimonadota bacterium]